MKGNGEATLLAILHELEKLNTNQEDMKKLQELQLVETGRIVARLDTIEGRLETMEGRFEHMIFEVIQPRFQRLEQDMERVKKQMGLHD